MRSTSTGFASALSLIALLAGCSATHLITEDDADAIASLDGDLDAARVEAGPRDVGVVDPPIPPARDAWAPDGDVVVLDAQGIEDARSFEDASARDGAVVTLDAATLDAAVVPADGATADAGGGGVRCGDATCADPQICCVQFSGRTRTMTCTAPDACAGTAITCDGPEDCAAGEVCCASRRGGSMGATACMSESMCRFGRACHVDADCPSRESCCSFMGFQVCSPYCY